MAEFEDFLSFVQAIDSYGREAGIVKIIPPKEWSVLYLVFL
jgi:jmjN domain